MKFFEIALTESAIDELVSDITDLVIQRKGINVEKMDFDEFLKLIHKRGNKISSGMLRDILDRLPIIQNVSASEIEFTGNIPDDMLDKDGVDDMADRVADLADQEGLAGVKSEL